MLSWPDISVPPIGIDLPPLNISTTSGKFCERGEEFKSYVCGITPYDATHLGHAATYLTFDLIHRYQVLRGQKLNFVENITDIDDPLFERANRDGVQWNDLGSEQIDLFKSDMTALRVLPPKAFVPVTEVIPEIISAITKVVENGYTYELEGDLYFRIKNFLGELPIAYKKALEIFAERGGDPNRTGKEHPLDPILWLKNKENEPGWDASFGFGRPGWHIECSVIALKNLIGTNYLKEVDLPNPLIDLQGGGSDLIFPHHFMSAALAKAITGNSFSSAFVHTGMIGLDGEKMSKSKGNLVFVSKLLNAGIDPMTIRYALLNSPYTADRMWTSEVLDQSDAKVILIRKALSMQEVVDPTPYIRSMVEHLSNNLDVGSALKELDKWVEQSLVANDFELDSNPGLMSRSLDALLGLAL